MKQTNNAIKFLMAQYRAIFKHAYLKGIASAVVLTAGLAASQAQAQDLTTGDYWVFQSGSTWKESNTPSINNVNTQTTIITGNVASDHTSLGSNSAEISDSHFIIGDGGTLSTIKGLSGGSAKLAAAFVELKNTTGNASASGNVLTLANNSTVEASSPNAANLFGAYVRANSGSAFADNNGVVIDQNATFTSTESYINGVSVYGYDSAIATNNEVVINGSNRGLQQSILGANVTGANTSSTKIEGYFAAQGNTVSVTNEVLADTTSNPRFIVGGNVVIDSTKYSNTTQLLSAGNKVELTNVDIGTNNGTKASVVAANIAENSGSSAFESVSAIGSEDGGLTITDSTLYGADVVGGRATNKSGGSANASYNKVALFDTNLRSITTGNTVATNLIGGDAQNDLSGSAIVELTASNNSVSVTNNKFDEDNQTNFNYIDAEIIGARLILSGAGDATKKAEGSSITANNNTVTISKGISLNRNVYGVLFDNKATSGTGAAVVANDNSVTFAGKTTGDVITVESDLIGNFKNITNTFDGNLTGTPGTPATIAGVHVTDNYQSYTADDYTKAENITVTVGENAVVKDADIWAVKADKTDARVVNANVTVNGDVTNASIYGGASAQSGDTLLTSTVTLGETSKLTLNGDTNKNFTIASDTVNLNGTINVKSDNTLTVQGYLEKGNLNTAATDAINTNSTSIGSNAAIYNAGTINLNGQTTVADGAVLSATATGAQLVVSAGSTYTDLRDTTAGGNGNPLDLSLVGGKGSLALSSTQLKSYLEAGDVVPETITGNTGVTTTDKAGTVVITSGGALEFTDNEVVLSDFDFKASSTGAAGATAADYGKIVVDSTTSTTNGSYIKGKTLVIEHELAENATTAQNGAYTGITAAGVNIEADVLKLGSDSLTSTDSTKIAFNKATVKDQLDFNVKSGSYLLTTDVVGARDYYTKDASGNYTTTLNEVGKITGDALQIGTAADTASGLTAASGSLTISGGAWVNEGQDLSIKSGSLTVGAVSGETVEAVPYSYTTNGNPASLTWKGTFKLDGANATDATVAVTGAAGADATLDLTNAEIGWGAGTIEVSGTPASLDKDRLTSAGEGILKITGSQFGDFAKNQDTKTLLEINGGGVVYATSSVDQALNFNKFTSGQAQNAGIVYFNNGGTLAVDGDLTLYTGSDDGVAAGKTSGSALDIGNGTISAYSLTLNNLSSKNDENKVEVKNGTIEVSARLNSNNDLIVFGGKSATDASLVLATDLKDGAGTVSSNLKFDTNSSLAVETGDWVLDDGKDIELTKSGNMTVGSQNDKDDNAASLKADNLKSAGQIDIYADGKATFATAQLSSDVNVSGVMTLTGKEGITEETDPAYAAKDTAGINLAGATINVNGAGAKFDLQSTAAKTLVTYTSGSEGSAASITVNDALKNATISATNNAEFRIDLEGLTVNADIAGQLKSQILDNLSNGAYLNVGKAALDIKIDDEVNKITAWENVKPFMDVQNDPDVTNDLMKQVLVNNVKDGDEVAGHFGAIQTAFSSTSRPLSVKGNLGLHQARDGYFVFQESNGQKTAMDVRLQSNSNLLLEGAGKIGGISSSGANADVSFITSEGSIQGPVEVLGDITGIDNLSIKTEAIVSGDVTVNELDMTAESALKADNLTITGAANTYGSLAMGTVDVSSGTLTLGKDSVAAELNIADGTVISDKLVLNGGSVLNVGWKAVETDSNPDDHFDETQTYSGMFQTQVADLNKGGIVLDPELTQPTALASITRFVDGSTEANNINAGSVNGSLFVGRNSALGIGTANLGELSQAIAKYQTNGALSDFGAMLVLNKQITLNDGDGIVMTARTNSDFVDYMGKSGSGLGALNGYNVLSNSIVFDDNTAMLISADAMNRLNGSALVTFTSNDAKLVANGGEIIIAGDVRADSYKLFDDVQDGVDVVGVDGSSGAVIEVSTENGFLVGKLTSETGGNLDLEVSADARAIMSGASNPVFTTLVAYAKGYNGDDPANESAQLYNGYKSATTEGADGTTTTTQVKNYDYNNDVLQYSISTGNGAAAEQVARLGIYGGSVQAALTAGATTYDAVSARMGVGAQTGSITFADNGQGAGLWVTPIYKNHDSDGFEAQGLSYGADMDMYGVALGGDYTLGNGLRVGAAFNVGSGDADGQGAGAGVSNDFDYYGFTVYGGYTMDKLSVVADVSYTVVDNDVEGNSGYGKVSTSMDTTNLSFGVTGQYTFNFNAVDVVPHAGLRYTYIDMDDYNVKDVDGDEVARYAGDSMSVFSIPVGVTFSKEIVSGEWTIKPAFDLTLTANVGDDSIDGSVNWGIDNLTTNLESEVIDSFTYGATLGVSAKTGNFSMGFGVNYTGASSADEYGVSANARFVF